MFMFMFVLVVFMFNYDNLVLLVLAEHPESMDSVKVISIVLPYLGSYFLRFDGV